MQDRARTVAIVEDDELVRLATVSLVRSLGLEVAEFPSALAFLDSPPAELGCIVSDLHMPGMSGVELHESLHANGSTVPFILMTAYPTEQIKDRAARGGIACLLEKPGAAEVLAGYLADVLGPLD
ncbi:MAG: response regulator transcription factor [Sphingomonas sp.]